MLYQVLKAIMRIAVEVFFKKIQLHNLDKVPVNKPLILASNHPSAFMDAIILSVFMKQELHYLVRSDVFNNPVKRWFFNKINLAPIYRIQEGVGQLHKNEETFEKCNEILKEGKTILIFSEGVCIQEKRLRKLKKGTARIAFGAEEAAGYDMDLEVVPVGINYSAPEKFRSNLFVNFGPAFSVKEYISLYKQDKVKGVNALTQRLENELEKRLIIINDKINDELVDQLETIYLERLKTKNDVPFSKPEKFFYLNKWFAENISSAYRKVPGRVEELRKLVKNYYKVIDNNKIKDYLVKEDKDQNLSSLLMKSLMMLLLFPLHLYGFLNNYIQFKAPYLLAKRIVKNVEFFSSVNIAAGTFIFLIFYIIQTLIAYNLFEGWIAFFYFLSLPISGYVSMYYWRSYKKLRGRWNFYLMQKNTPQELIKLKRMRGEIIMLTDDVLES